MLQGSAFGSALFLIHIQDLLFVTTIPSTAVKTTAPSIPVFHLTNRNINRETVAGVLNRHLRVITVWGAGKLVKFNSSKTY